MAWEKFYIFHAFIIIISLQLAIATESSFLEYFDLCFDEGKSFKQSLTDIRTYSCDTYCSEYFLPNCEICCVKIRKIYDTNEKKIEQIKNIYQERIHNKTAKIYKLQIKSNDTENKAKQKQEKIIPLIVLCALLAIVVTAFVVHVWWRRKELKNKISNIESCSMIAKDKSNDHVINGVSVDVQTEFLEMKEFGMQTTTDTLEIERTHRIVFNRSISTSDTIQEDVINKPIHAEAGKDVHSHLLLSNDQKIQGILRQQSKI